MTEPPPVEDIKLEGAPVQYLTLHLLAPNGEIVRLATTHIGAWGEHIRMTGESPRTYVVAVWGQSFECSETLAEVDALMGFTGVAVGEPLPVGEG